VLDLTRRSKETKRRVCIATVNVRVPDERMTTEPRGRSRKRSRKGRGKVEELRADEDGREVHQTTPKRPLMQLMEAMEAQAQIGSVAMGVLAMILDIGHDVK